ncbi:MULTISPECIES: DUF6522 family protein [Roseomonadaceae]|uniref:Uncharacterized protein n=1 Tax=Falsiroseomonas oleicola TaxID=2801474 RepID=A0ABS6H888_9PROT|nr:DUF6522 family protein [Roseomonas oleicola]MBU8543701.1 hypothetical protein [Roseomonas oleicola]
MTLPERVEIDAAGDVALTAEQAAALLGVALPDFLADLRAGHVYSVVERGEGADAGRLRLTLHRRATQRRLLVEAGTGRVLGPG